MISKIVSRTRIPPSKIVVAKADSGATNHYIRDCDAAILKNIRIFKGPTVQLPNDETLQSKAQGELSIPTISQVGRNSHILPGLTSSSLLSMGQLCDDGCEIKLTKSDIKIFKNKNLIIQGERNFEDGLWDIKLTTPNYKINAIIRKDTTTYDLIHYLHACCFSPPISTFKKAIRKGNFLTWPGLQQDTKILKYLEETMATAKGHLDQERKHLQSTKIYYEECESDEDKAPIAQATTMRTRASLLSLETFQPKQKGYLDLTGKFPYQSARGNQYLLVAYDYDSNAILVQALPNRQKATITKSWKSINDILAKSGAQPIIYVMDNEASADLKSAMHSKDIKYELVPPHIHRRNAAERAIRTFKNHFIAGLASLDPNFPMAQWDRLLDQAVLTINHLRNARANPNLSAHAYLHGVFDFARTPLAPPGTRVLIHEKSTNRNTWAAHGTSAWYIGPAIHHYRCVKCFVPSTDRERDADTVKYFPHAVQFPKTTLEDYLRQSASDILDVLHQKPNMIPSLSYGNNTRNAVDLIAKLLNRQSPRPPLRPIPVQTTVTEPRVQPIPPPIQTRNNNTIPPTHNEVREPRVQTIITEFRGCTKRVHHKNGNRIIISHTNKSTQKTFRSQKIIKRMRTFKLKICPMTYTHHSPEQVTTKTTTRTDTFEPPVHVSFLSFYKMPHTKSTTFSMVTKKKH